MNVVSYLREKSNDFFTIEKYDLEDMANSHQIKFIVEYSNDIRQYFEDNKLNGLSGIEQYYDLKYIEYVCSFEVFQDKLPVDVAEQLIEIIDVLKSSKSAINRGNIIKCIMSNYEAIFSLARSMADMGLTNALLYDIRFNYSGLKNTEIFDFLVSEKTYLVFGQFEEFLDILKKDDNRLLKALMVDNLHNVLRSNFKEICEVVKLLYYRKYTEIACGSGQIIYDYLMTRYRQQENILALQSDFKTGYETLYVLKMDLARKLREVMRDIDRQVVKLVKETGHTTSYEYSNKIYVDALEANKDINPMFKYMTITHELSSEQLWLSMIDKYSIEHNEKPINPFDRIMSSDRTNDYFTHSRLHKMNNLINIAWVNFLYWFGKEDTINEFNECLRLVVGSMFELLDYDITYEGIEENVDDVVLLIKQAVQENESGINLYTKLMFNISFLEKILRLVNIALDDSVYFEKNMTLAGLFGKKYEYNKSILTVLGEDHLRWTRYFLLNDDDKIGFGYRNRMAHLRDINPNTMTNAEFMRITWLIISTINTIYINIANNDWSEND